MHIVCRRSALSVELPSYFLTLLVCCSPLATPKPSPPLRWPLQKLPLVAGEHKAAVSRSCWSHGRSMQASPVGGHGGGFYLETWPLENSQSLNGTDVAFFICSLCIYFGGGLCQVWVCAPPVSISCVGFFFILWRRKCKMSTQPPLTEQLTVNGWYTFLSKVPFNSNMRHWNLENRPWSC